MNLFSAYPRHSAAPAMLLAFVFLFASSSLCKQSDNAEIAIISKIRGLVSVMHSGENGHVLASTGYLLLNGSIIQTGKDGYAQIKFIDTRSTISVRPESQVILRTTKNTKTTTKVCALNSGTLLADVDEGRGKSFDISSPGALLTLSRGKTLVILSQNGEETTVFNLGENAAIADASCRSWLKLSANTAAFASSNGLVHAYAIPASQIPRVQHVVSLAADLKQSSRIDFDLVLKSGGNGTVSPSGKMAVLSGIDVDIRAVPDTGFFFAGWKVVDGAAHISDVTDTQTQVQVSTNSIIEARFSELPCKLAIKTKGNGTTVPAGEISVPKNSPVTVMVVPAEGFEFVGWKTSKNIKLSDENYPATTITLGAASGTATAQFIQKKYRLEIVVNGQGTVMPKKPLKINYGTPTAISAVAKQGSRFINWSVVQGAAKIENPRMAETKVICDSLDATLEALFSDDAIEVSVISHEKAPVSPSGNFQVVRNSVIELDAKPVDGYTVLKWDIVRGRARVNGFENATVKCGAPFEIQPVVVTKTYDLTLQATGLGAVIPAKPTKVVHATQSRIIAVPQKGKHFIRWKLTSGWASIQNVQDDSTIATLTRGPAILLAEFAPTLCSLKVETTPGGYTEPGGVLKNYDGGEIALQAVPNPKAAFLNWEIVKGADNVIFSDTVTEPVQTITSIKGHATIKAIFSTDAVELTVLNNGLGTTSPDGKIFVVKDRWSAIKASPNREQVFVQWTAVAGANVQFMDRMSMETDVSISDNSVIKAFFSPIESAASQTQIAGSGTYTLSIAYDENRGNVAQGAELEVNSGIPASLAATAKSGYSFSQWRTIKGYAAISSPYSSQTNVTLSSGDATIEAQFQAKPVGSLETKFLDYQGRTKTIKSSYK